MTEQAREAIRNRIERRLLALIQGTPRGLGVSALADANELGSRLAEHALEVTLREREARTLRMLEHPGPGGAPRVRHLPGNAARTSAKRLPRRPAWTARRRPITPPRAVRPD